MSFSNVSLPLSLSAREFAFEPKDFELIPASVDDVIMGELVARFELFDFNLDLYMSP